MSFLTEVSPEEVREYLVTHCSDIVYARLLGLDFEWNEPVQIRFHDGTEKAVLVDQKTKRFQLGEIEGDAVTLWALVDGIPDEVAIARAAGESICNIVTINEAPAGTGAVSFTTAPKPLTQNIDPEPFPLDCLENDMHRQLVEALARESECPVDLAATQSLPTVAAVIQSKTKYDITHLEMPCIYAVGLAASGERKSPIERALSKPLHTIYAEQMREHKQLAAAGADEARCRQATIKRLEKEAAKTDDAKQRANKLAMIKELKSSEAELLPPQPLIATEGTTAGIKRAMMRPGSKESLFFSDSEGRFVEILFGGAFDSGGEADTDIIQKAYTADPCNGLRGREDAVQGAIESPTLSIGLIIQARMVDKFFQHESNTYKGSIARFLWCWPKSMAGNRTLDTPRCPRHLLEWWEKLLRDLHECTPPVNQYGERGWHELSAEPEAIAAWRQFIQELEPQRDPDSGSFAVDGEAMLSWAGKLEGHVIRLAIALHAILHGSGYVEQKISERTMQNAIRLTRYYISHARRVFVGYGLNQVVQDAQKVLRIVRRIHDDAPGEPVTHTDLLNKGANNLDTKRLMAALARLEECRYIKLEEVTGEGKRPRRIYHVNTITAPNRPKFNPVASTVVAKMA